MCISKMTDKNQYFANYKQELEAIAALQGLKLEYYSPVIVNGGLTPPPSRIYPNTTCYMVTLRIGLKEFCGFGPTNFIARTAAEYVAHKALCVKQSPKSPCKSRPQRPQPPKKEFQFGNVAHSCFSKPFYPKKRHNKQSHGDVELHAQKLPEITVAQTIPDNSSVHFERKQSPRQLQKYEFFDSSQSSNSQASLLSLSQQSNDDINQKANSSSNPQNEVFNLYSLSEHTLTSTKPPVITSQLITMGEELLHNTISPLSSSQSTPIDEHVDIHKSIKLSVSPTCSQKEKQLQKSSRLSSSQNIPTHVPPPDYKEFEKGTIHTLSPQFRRANQPPPSTKSYHVPTSKEEVMNSLIQCSLNPPPLEEPMAFNFANICTPRKDVEETILEVASRKGLLVSFEFSVKHYTHRGSTTQVKAKAGPHVCIASHNRKKMAKYLAAKQLLHVLEKLPDKCHMALDQPDYAMTTPSLLSPPPSTNTSPLLEPKHSLSQSVGHHGNTSKNNDIKDVNSIGQLQELMMQQGQPLPVYSVSCYGSSGHINYFMCTVQAGNLSAIGMGPTKKASRKMAAKHLLSLMAKKGQNVIPAKAKKSRQYHEKGILSPCPNAIPSYPSSESDTYFSHNSSSDDSSPASLLSIKSPFRPQVSDHREKIYKMKTISQKTHLQPFSQLVSKGYGRGRGRVRKREPGLDGESLSQPARPSSMNTIQSVSNRFTLPDCPVLLPNYSDDLIKTSLSHDSHVMKPLTGKPQQEMCPDIYNKPKKKNETANCESTIPDEHHPSVGKKFASIITSEDHVERKNNNLGSNKVHTPFTFSLDIAPSITALTTDFKSSSDLIQQDCTNLFTSCNVCQLSPSDTSWDEVPSSSNIVPFTFDGADGAIGFPSEGLQ